MFNIDSRNSKFIEIYSDYYSLVFGSVCTRISDVDDAEDITQEIFIRYYRKMDEVLEPRKWLMGTMKMVLFEYYKKKKVDTLDIEEVYNDTALTFVNGMRDLRIMIKDVLDDDETFKNDKDRLIFDLIAIQRYTMDETSREIGLSRDQVKYRYSLISKSIIHSLRKRGISNFEDLLR